MKTQAQRLSGGRFVQLLLALLALLLLCTIAWRIGWVGDAWRAAYPHLPSRVQGLPYRLRAAWPGERPTPVALPPVAAQPGGRQSQIDAQDEERAPRDESPQEGAPLANPPTVSKATAGDASDEPTLPSTPTPWQRAAPKPGPSTPAPPTFAPPTPAPPLPTAAALSNLRHSYQTWNNCGPATIDMALSAWQVPGDQAQAAVRLKPDPDDKNVAPRELARYAAERGLEAPVLQGGSLDILLRLVASGVPVILETWFVPDPGDEMGHYRLLVGYRDDGDTLLFYDSYLGPDLAIDAAAVDADWRAFNRLYVPVYPPQRRADVKTAIGPAFDDPRAMWTIAAAQAQQEATTTDDAFAHFNLGTSLAGMGDMTTAAAAFDRARERGLPWRMLWYQHGPFAVYAALDRWPDVLALAEANLRNAPNLEESLVWRAAAKATAGESEPAREDLLRAQRLNPLYVPATTALEALEEESDVADALIRSGAGLPVGAMGVASPTP